MVYYFRTFQENEKFQSNLSIQEPLKTLFMDVQHLRKSDVLSEIAVQ